MERVMDHWRNPVCLLLSRLSIGSHQGDFAAQNQDILVHISQRSAFLAQIRN
jgi:hypothetical protein